MTYPAARFILVSNPSPKPQPGGNCHVPAKHSFCHRLANGIFRGGGGYPTTEARSIPWDCSDWQAFAHADRPTAILESLAENRGKTLYCGIDQSDTFSKAETWQAGKDRNERDDTVYFGERGQFRGFIAAQEGWLTDGESGVTGVSIDRIFEFPREERRRTKRVKRFKVGSGDVATDTCRTDLREGRQPGALLCSDWGAASGAVTVETTGIRLAEIGWANAQDSGSRTWNSAWTVSWETFPAAEYWQTRAETVAVSGCRARGGRYVAGSAAFGPGHSDFSRSGLNHGAGLGWFYVDNEELPSHYNHQARQSRTWTATCKKTVRRSRK